MKDEFDKRLSDHIAEVFDNFEDSSADAGWTLLRKRYPEKKNRRGVIWLWLGSAAALLLLLLGIEMWNGKEYPDSTKVTVKSNGKQKTAVNADSIGQIARNNVKRVPPEAKDQEQSSAPRAQLTVTMQATPKNNKPVSKGVKSSAIAVNTTPILSQSVPVTTDESAKNAADKNNEQQHTATNTTPLAKQLADTASSKKIAQNEVKPAKPVIKSPFTENDPIIKKTKNDKHIASNKTVTFGIYAATYLNYASGSSSQVNMGAGVASDIRLTKNLKVSTGVAVNQNTFDYGNHLPQRYGEYLAAATPVTLLPATYAASNNLAASYSIPILKNYNAQLTSLDIPLNLKYEFNPQKSTSFISFGLSSGTFINETYNSQYSYANSASQTQNTNSSNFNGFYFAKTLDFSFGLGYPIGKNNLSIEPFVKYPLQGLGADQIRFGAGGLNLKFNFSNSKK